MPEIEKPKKPAPVPADLEAPEPVRGGKLVRNPELQAMSAVDEILADLEPEVASRVLWWANQRYGPRPEMQVRAYARVDPTASAPSRVCNAPPLTPQDGGAKGY